MRFFRSIAWLLKGWLLSFAIFGLLVTLLGVQFAWSPNFSRYDATRLAVPWVPWAVVAPLLFLVVARWPLFGDRSNLAPPVHLMCAVATFALCTWWGEFIVTRLPVDPARPVVPHGHFGPGRSFGSGGTHGAGWHPPGGGVRWEPPHRSIWNQYFLALAFRLPIYLAILSLAHALHFYRRSQSRERHGLELEAGLARARLEALQMQLQPHFLFNSLNAIAALIHKDPEAADEMVAALSDFLRLTLESRTEQELPLRRELEFVERYLAIEKVRFGERLRFAIDTPAETLSALVPALVLQPLVENAVRHGLEPKVGGGSLTITARRQDDQLVLTVGDDGAGFGGQTPREGIGLVNTRARLGELYGKDALLEMRNGDGVEVKITLPYHTVAA